VWVDYILPPQHRHTVDTHHPPVFETPDVPPDEETVLDYQLALKGPLVIATEEMPIFCRSASTFTSRTMTPTTSCDRPGIGEGTFGSAGDVESL
jgi:hypothetical protein